VAFPSPKIKRSKQLHWLILFIEFLRDYRTFSRLHQGSERKFAFSWRDRFPCFGEKTGTTAFDRHYVYHPAWAARILAASCPENHVDISSTLNFCSLVSAFLPVSYFDYRPAELELDNLDSGGADLLALPFLDNELQSLSCMHVVEHIGLGRYGDIIDPDGDLKAIAELKRVLAPGGNLLFVVPVGRPKIVFNAHRVYSYRQVVDYFSDLDLHQFALIPDRADDGGLLECAPEELVDEQNYGCGCFWFVKPV